MTCQELLERITYSELLMWEKFFEYEEKNPSTTEWYLMQIAAEVRGIFSEKPIDLNSLIIPFIRVSAPPSKASKPQTPAVTFPQENVASGSDLDFQIWSGILSHNKKRIEEKKNKRHEGASSNTPKHLSYGSKRKENKAKKRKH